MDIHDDKIKRHTLTAIQRKIIAGLLNSRAKSQQKIHKLKPPSAKDLEAINCGKTQVKTIIYGAKTKETNQSIQPKSYKYLLKPKPAKIVKDIPKKENCEPFIYKEPLKLELRSDPIFTVNKTHDIIFSFTNISDKEVPSQDIRSINTKSKDYKKSILPIHNDTSNPFATDEDDNDNDNNINTNANTNANANTNINKDTTPILELNSPHNLINLANSAISAIKTTLTSNTLNSNLNKEREIVLLNFEDDTVRPVLNLSTEKINIIKKWYELCDMLVDIEPTNIVIPEYMNIKLLEPYLYNNFQISETNKYINEYIPLVISNLYIQSQLSNFSQFNNTLTNSTNNNFIVSKTDLEYGEFTKVNTSKYIFKQPVLQPNCCKKENTKFKLDNYKVTIPEKLLKRVSECKEDKIDQTFNLNGGILPFNEDYNCLKPYLGTNCESIGTSNNINCNNYNNEIKQSTYNNQTDSLNKTTITVIFNIDCNKSLVINTTNNSNELSILNSNPEFGFLELFSITTSNNEIIKYIESQFSNGCFLDINILNTKMEQTAEHIKLLEQEKATDNSLTQEKQLVITYFKSNFIINDDINKRMKASTLYDLVVNSNVLNLPKDKLSGFKNRLSEYLKEIGLQKKRYNDGFYYYGIIDKSTITNLSERIKLYEKEGEIIKNSSLQKPELFNYIRPESVRLEINENLNTYNEGNLYYKPIIPTLRTDTPNPNIKIQPFK